MSILPVVDLSGLLGSARSQGQRSTCMAFAMSDLNRSIASAPDILSAEFLYQTAGAITLGWAPGMGLRLLEAIKATQAPGQPLEIHFPYQANDPVTVANPPPPIGQPLFSSSVNVRVNTMNGIVDELTKGNLVGLVIRVTPGFFSPIAGVVPYATGVVPNAYHAVLAVGWGTDAASNSRHLFIRNSWGSGWALAGHAWMPEQYVNLHVLAAFGR